MLTVVVAVAAALPVLYGGDATLAAHNAAADAGIPVWETMPVALDTLVKGDGIQLVGAGKGPACTSEGLTNASLRDLVGRAEKFVAIPDPARARRELDGATARLGCLVEPAEASLLTRMFVLSAHLAAEAGDADAAREAFRRARMSQPDLKGDPRLSPEGDRLLAEVLAAAFPAQALVAGPGVASDTVIWLDGRSASLATTPALTAGVHLIQTLQPVRTWIVDVSVGAPLALTTSSWSDDSLTLADPTRRVLVDAVVDEVYGRDAEVLFWTGRETWRISESWTLLPRSPATPAPTVATRRGVGIGLAVAGGGVMVAGGTVAALNFFEGVLDNPRDQRQGAFSTAGAFAIGGAVVAATGLGISVRSGRSSVGLAPGSVWVAAAW